MAGKRKFYEVVHVCEALAKDEVIAWGHRGAKVPEETGDSANASQSL